MHIRDENWAIGKAFASIQNDNRHYFSRSGEFNFERGSVLINHWLQGPEEDRYITSLSFYFNNRGYYRTIETKKPYTDIGLARIAGKFGREIIKKHWYLLK